MKVIFDDWTQDDSWSQKGDSYTHNNGRWACMCSSCKEKYKVPRQYLHNGGGWSSCGVDGCRNEADYYIDFPVGATKEKADYNLEFTFEEEAK